MSCCGTRNLLLAFRSQDFDRCHSFLLALPVPASGSLHMRLIFETSLSFISYPGAACQSKPEALCALKLAQDEIGLAGIEPKLDAYDFPVRAVAAADPVAQRGAAVKAVDHADAVCALCPAQRRVDGDACLRERHAVDVKFDDWIVHGAIPSSRSSARLRARPPA